MFVTGCAGFLGKNLINALAEKEVNVIGVDKAVSGDCEFKNIQIRKADILNKESLFGIKRELDKVKSGKICLVHLAGISSVDGCRKNQESAYETNVKSTQAILGLADDCGIGKIIFPSSALVYGSKYSGLISEEFPLSPESSYAQGKVDSENYLVNNSENSGIDLVIFRLANIYGAGTDKDTVVNTIVKQLGQDYLQLKEYKSVRDYLCVSDVVGAFIKAIFSKCKFKIYNIGSGTGYSVWQLVKVIAALTGKEGVVAKIGLSDAEASNGSRLVLSFDRAKKDLNWAAEFSLKNGLKRMLNA